MTEPVSAGGVTASAVVERLRSEIEALVPPASVSTGLGDLDDLLHGLRPGRVYVVGGRHGVGKSALALRIARAVLDTGMPVLYRSLDMTPADIVLRLVAAESSLAVADIQERSIDPEDWPSWRRLRAGMDRVAGLPLTIDTGSGDSGELAEGVRSLARDSGGLGLVVVDDLQRLVLREAGPSRSERVEVLMQRLRGIARDGDVPVIACAQCASPVQSGGAIGPHVMGDLRDADAVAGSADVILLLSGIEAGLGPGLTQLGVAKNRHGATGDFTLAFIDHIVRFAAIASTP